MIVITKETTVYTINGIDINEWLAMEKLPDGVKWVLDEDSELGKKIIDANFLIDPIFDDSGELIAVMPKAPPEPDLLEVRKAKNDEISISGKKVIERGFDYDLNGKTIHFSLTDQDQSNITGLYNDLLMVKQGLPSMAGIIQKEGDLLVPYHDDGGICKYFPSLDWIQITARMGAVRLYNTTKMNLMHRWVDTLTDIAEINSVNFDTAMPEKYENHLKYITSGGVQGQLMDGDSV